MRNIQSSIKLFLHRNGGTILSCASAIGVAATAITTTRSTIRAKEILDKAKEDSGNDLSRYKTVKLTWREYVVPVIIGTSTVACILSASILNNRRQSAMISAYAILNKAYNDYQDKVKEWYGEEEHQKIMDSIVVENAEDVAVYATACFSESCLLSGDSQKRMLFYDENSKRYFESTIEQVIQAEYHLNRNFVLGGFAQLNMLYEFLGLDTTAYGEELGWAIEDELYWVDFDHKKVVLNDGRECIVIHTPFAPTLDWSTYRYA